MAAKNKVPASLRKSLDLILFSWLINNKINFEGLHNNNSTRALHILEKIQAYCKNKDAALKNLQNLTENQIKDYLIDLYDRFNIKKVEQESQ